MKNWGEYLPEGVQNLSEHGKILPELRRNRMAELFNVERNIRIKTELSEVEEVRESDCETWVSGSLEIESKTFHCGIGHEHNFMLNIFEIKNFMCEIQNMLDCLRSKKEYSFHFSNYEYNFEIKMDSVVADEVVEVELWINWGNYTNGEEAGYDIGIRFIVQREVLQKFYNSCNEEIHRVLKK